MIPSMRCPIMKFATSTAAGLLEISVGGAVGFGVGLMIFLNVTHPPAGGNPIIVIMGSVSPDYLLNPVISGSIIILGFGIIINRFILKKSYPKSK